MPDQNPKHYYHLLPNQVKLINTPYYYGELSEVEANKILVGKESGSFIIRLEREKDVYSIAISYRQDFKLYTFGIPFGPNKDTSFNATAIMHEPNFIKFGYLDAEFKLKPRNHAMKYNEVSQNHTAKLDCKHNNYVKNRACPKFNILIQPINRKSVFSLQELSMAVIRDNINYSQLAKLPLPQIMINELQKTRIKNNTKAAPNETYCEGSYNNYNWDVGPIRDVEETDILEHWRYEATRGVSIMFQEDWVPQVEGPHTLDGKGPERM